ncbi:cell division protein ZapA [Thalassospira sp. HF15]|uniref:cell division protein ZapA n=1 Tax=Thalassospira sp. HF15 TaxID=2722755 RepID=UPI0014312189|nr:cell division protein ZapA [Thalassospira sp. HF15]NIY75936.1 cell division protein ZapA [Thalassospira sp. HF15]
MAQVSIRINGRSYDIACDDGQEDRIHALAKYVDERVKEISDAVGQIGEQRLLVMTSLLIADELGMAHEKLDNPASQAAEPDPGSLTAAESDALADNIDSMAERVEALADRLGKD